MERKSSATRPGTTKSASSKRVTAPKRPSTTTTLPPTLADDIAGLIDLARQATARTVDTLMTSAYFEVGRRIVEQEQLGASKAPYGAQTLAGLARVVSARLGRGFGQRNLFHMRAFFLAYRERQPPILQTPSAEFARASR